MVWLIVPAVAVDVVVAGETLNLYKLIIIHFILWGRFTFYRTILHKQHKNWLEWEEEKEEEDEEGEGVLS